LLVESLSNFLVVRSGPSVLSNSSLFGSVFSNVSTRKGASVTNQTVLQLSGFYRGINLICNDFAKIPKHVVQKQGNKTIYLDNHPIHTLINKRPNQYMNAWGFDSILINCAILRGNGYAEIIRDQRTAQITALQYIDERYTPVIVKRHDNQLFYHFSGRTVLSDDIIHYRSLFSENGITGIGIVTYAAKSLGVALSSQEFAEEYYSSKGMGTVVVTTEKDMTDTAKKNYAGALSSKLSDGSPFKVAVVDDGNKFHHVQLSAQESMFLETNKQAIHEIANWLGLPPHKLGALENSNNSNMVQQNVSYVSDSIIPWKFIIQQEYNTKLFSPKEEAQGIQTHFDDEILLQSDKLAQSRFFRNLVYAGIITSDQAAQKLGFPSLPGGDQRMTPVNMQTQEQIDKKLQENADKTISK